MKTVTVKVKGDHLQAIAKVGKPINAVAELVWNALDADAKAVSVIISENQLGGLDKLSVRDDGHGISYEEATPAFESLGGSWKKTSRKTRILGRLLHGREGKGRFKALGIGSLVEWQTRYSDNGYIKQYVITASANALDKFEISEPEQLSSSAKTGTEVTVFLDKGYKSLQQEHARQDLTEQLALYLNQYPGINIEYNGGKLEPQSLIQRMETIPLKTFKSDEGKEIPADLVVIEWLKPTDRALYLCDENGFTLGQVSPGVHAPGFNFTAYLRSPYFRVMDEDGSLDLQEVHPVLNRMIEAAREGMRQYFRVRAAEQTSEVVDQWKKDKVYPYDGEPKSPIEEAERQVFDVLALNVNSYLPDFEEADNKSKRFSLILLKEALESNPSSLQTILKEVLDLPAEKQDELAQLLEKTTLVALINASKIVADRLSFIAGLELLVFDSESKKTLLERSQLHRILTSETWIFGEHFNISVDDQSLNEALRKHLKLMGRDELAPEPVKIEGQEVGIVDLMLSRNIPTHHTNEREHLVIELKRPSQKVDTDVENQIINYAVAVANDERFRDIKTRWDFWAISNELSDTVRKKSNQRNRPQGLLYEDAEAQIFVWAKTWAQVIQDCKHRLHFFQQHLSYRADSASALEYLRKTHDKYLPKQFT